jgi:hypothetical protein
VRVICNAGTVASQPPTEDRHDRQHRERAQDVVKAVKKDALAADPSLNTDAIWDRALSYPKQQGFPVTREFCQFTLHQLTSSNQAGAIEIQQP